MRLTIILHAIRTRLCCSLREPSALHRPQPFSVPSVRVAREEEGKTPKRAGQTRRSLT